MFLPAFHFTRVSGINLIEAVQGSVTAGGASSINMPANAGRSDVLVIGYLSGGQDDPNFDAPTLSGFSSISAPTGYNHPRSRVVYAYGPGATATLTTNSTTRNVAYILYSFLGAKLAEAPLVTSDELGIVPLSVPDPPSRTSTVNASEFVLFASVNSITTTSGWSAPSGYSSLLTQSAGDPTTAQNVVVLSARKNLATAGADNPGTFAHASVTGYWTAATVVIKPA